MCITVQQAGSTYEAGGGADGGASRCDSKSTSETKDTKKESSCSII